MENSLALSRLGAREGIQADLFDGTRVSASVFLNVDEVNQEEFLSIISRNPIVKIVDLRASPVFRRPKFDHKFVMKYLSRYNIPYVDIIVRILSEDSETKALSEIVQECLDSLRRGTVLFIYDGVAGECGRPTLMRKFLRQSGAMPVEMNCRFLNGYNAHV